MQGDFEVKRRGKDKGEFYMMYGKRSGMFYWWEYTPIEMRRLSHLDSSTSIFLHLSPIHSQTIIIVVYPDKWKKIVQNSVKFTCLSFFYSFHFSFQTLLSPPYSKLFANFTTTTTKSSYPAYLCPCLTNKKLKICHCHKLQISEITYLSITNY